MKAHELSVGDYVEYRGKPCKIIEVSLYSVLLSGVPAKRSIEHISPIPLTKEIIEYNGFFVDGIASECVADGAFVEKPLYKCEGDGWFVEFDGWTVRVVCDCPEREVEITPAGLLSENVYVHELQHALNICRIEKEIKV